MPIGGRAFLRDPLEIDVFLVEGAGLPTAEQDADPLECQGSHGGVMTLSLGLLPLVELLGPGTLRNGTRRKLMEGLPHKFRTRPAEMNPELGLPAARDHWRDAAERPHLVGTPKALS